MQVSYSLNTFMPIEGYDLAFNGHRAASRSPPRAPARDAPHYDEVVVMRNFGGAERIQVPHEPGGHFGGDLALQKMLFGARDSDPLGQCADARAGAVSVLCGVAAVESLDAGRPVELRPLMEQAAVLP